jgi:hypothetical protein
MRGKRAQDKIIDRITDILAYMALPITYPLMLWQWRKWQKKRNQEIQKYK